MPRPWRSYNTIHWVTARLSLMFRKISCWKLYLGTFSVIKKTGGAKMNNDIPTSFAMKNQKHSNRWIIHYIKAIKPSEGDVCNCTIPEEPSTQTGLLFLCKCVYDSGRIQWGSEGSGVGRVTLAERGMLVPAVTHVWTPMDKWRKASPTGWIEIQGTSSCREIKFI